MDQKLALVSIVTLIIGGLTGYIGSSYNFNLQIDQLDTQIVKIQSQYADLSEENNALTNEYNKISNDYANLTSQITELTDINDDLSSMFIQVQNEKDDLLLEYTNLENMYQEIEDYLEEKVSLELEVESLNLMINDLNSSYNNLLYNYSNLLEEYNMINGPKSQFMSINDLVINFTLEKHIFNYTESVKGSVSIFKTNGEPFVGEISFQVLKEGAGLTINAQPINGEKNIYIPSPVFVYGPGTYTIQINWIRDTNSFYVAINRDLYETRITVEAF